MITNLSVFPTPAPLEGQSKTDFVTNASGTLGYMNTFVGDFNSRVGEFNTAYSDINSKYTAVMNQAVDGGYSQGYLDNEYKSTLNTGFKNLIINGNFDIWQRGTSFGSSGFSADRWKTGGGIGSIVKDGNSMKITTSSTDPYSFYTVEDLGNKLNGKTATVSIKSKSSDGGTGLQYLSHNGANYWTEIEPIDSDGYIRYSTTFIIDDSQTDKVVFTLEWQPTDGIDINIKEVQLELGSVATPFEYRPYALELSLCRRYFRKYTVQEDTSNLALQMRIEPTESGTSPYTYDAEL